MLQQLTSFDGMNTMHRSDGFSLLEILFALGIISLTLLVLTLAEVQSDREAAGLHERTLAQWIAMNKLTELRLAPEWPATGNSNGQLEYANRQWRWSVEVSNTQDPDLRRIEISVAPATTPDAPFKALIGFRGRPQPRPVPLGNPDDNS